MSSINKVQNQVIKGAPVIKSKHGRLLADRGPRLKRTEKNVEGLKRTTQPPESASKRHGK